MDRIYHDSWGLGVLFEHTVLGMGLAGRVCFDTDPATERTILAAFLSPSKEPMPDKKVLRKMTAAFRRASKRRGEVLEMAIPIPSPAPTAPFPAWNEIPDEDQEPNLKEPDLEKCEATTP